MMVYLNAPSAVNNQIKTNKIMKDFSYTNAFSLFGIVAVVCLVFGYTLGASDVRKEAVKHSSARWIAEDNGAPKFIWGQ